MRCHVVPPRLLVLLLESSNLLLLGLEVRLESIVLALQLIYLMLKLCQLRIPGGLFCFVTKHELGLLGLCASRTLLNFSLTSVEVFSFFVKLGLKIKHLALFLLLEDF